MKQYTESELASIMERHPEWFDRKSTSSGFVIYWGLKMKEVI